MASSLVSEPRLQRAGRAAVAALVALLAAAPATAKQEYLLGSGDIIHVNVFKNADLSLDARVSEVGTISFPLVGSVMVRGMTLPAAEHKLAQLLQDGGFVVNPQVSIMLTQAYGNLVSVIGEVNNAGRYSLDASGGHLSGMLAAAGGTGFVIRELLDAGLLHDDVTTILGRGLRAHCAEPFLRDTDVIWNPVPARSGDESVLRPVAAPFAADGGLILVEGNLGRAVMKISAVKPEHRTVEAPALVFDSQEAFMHAYKLGQLERDFVAVVRFQGPRANGMPELHALTPPLSNLQDAGYHVALVTDGRMSGASGKVPAAIHVSPEVLAGGRLGLVRDGDIIRLDAVAGRLDARVSAEVWAARTPARADLSANGIGMGRELFTLFRANVSAAELGATTFALTSLAPAVPLHDPVRVREAEAFGFAEDNFVQTVREEYDAPRDYAHVEGDSGHRH